MSTLDFVIIIFYLAVTIGVGVYYGRGVRSLRDFAVGNGSLPVVVMVATIAATTNGGNAFIGQSEKLYFSGLIFALVMCGYPINGLLMAKYIAPRMSPFQGSISVGDLMDQQFGTLGRVTAGLFAFIKTTGTVAGQVTALAIFMSSFIGVPLYLSVITSSAIVVLYSSYGGVRSVVTTDAVQFCIMMVGIPLLTALSMKYAGGNKVVLNQLFSQEFLHHDEHLLSYLSLFFIFAIPVLPPALVQRLLMMKDIKKLSHSFKMSAYVDIPTSIIVIFMVGAFMTINPPDVAPNNIVPYLVETVLPAGARGLVIAAMMAAIMSTADSNVNAASVAFINDVLKPLTQKTYSRERELTLVRLASAAVGLFAIMAALYFKSIFDIALAFLNVWIPVMVVPLYAVIFRQGGGRRDFIRSATGGISGWFLWKKFGQAHLEIHPVLISLVCSFVCFHWSKIGAYLAKNSQSPGARPADSSRNHTLGERFTKGLNALWSWFYTRADHCHSDMGLFGLFCGFAYVLSVFLIPMNLSITSVMLMQTTGAIACFSVIFRGFFPGVMQKYFSFIWFFVLSYTMAFVPSVLLLLDPSAYILIPVIAAYFLLSVIVDWAFFLTVLYMGSLSALLLVILAPLVDPQTLLVRHEDGAVTLTAALFCISLVGGIFSRKRDKIEHEKRRVANAIVGEIAHELRTPLQAILIHTKTERDSMESLLSAPEVQPHGHLVAKVATLRHVPSLVRENVEHAFKIIHMVLNNLRKISLDKAEPIMLRTFVNKVVGAYPLDEAQRELITVDRASLENLRVYGNPELLQNVIDNLLKNALRALTQQPQGMHRIKIWGQKQGDRARQYRKILLCVEDTGTGIDPEKLMHIFEPFYTTERVGTGIGLSFCKDVMRVHGGDIYCASEVGEFTRFTLEFPDIH